MAPKNKTPKERLEKYLRRCKKTQEALRNMKLSQSAAALPSKDYLSDEKFKETLTPHQEKSLRTLDAAERQAMLKFDVRRLVNDSRNELVESREFYEYKAKLAANVIEHSHRATTEFFEDRNEVDDSTLISMDTAYYLALSESGVDPECYIELL